MLTIRLANSEDVEIVAKHDTHISKNLVKDKVLRNEIYVVYDTDRFVGWLRYGLFWDTIPFMNMLEILPGYQGKGIGRQLVSFWEAQMKAHGYKMVMTSTQQNEHAQHFYSAVGYIGVGGFIQSCGVVIGESYEIIFMKDL